MRLTVPAPRTRRGKRPREPRATPRHTKQTVSGKHVHFWCLEWGGRNGHGYYYPLMASLKIKCVEIDGEKAIPPTVFKLLTEFGEHRKTCFGCNLAWELQDARSYCDEGRKFIDALLADPNVELLPD